MGDQGAADPAADPCPQTALEKCPRRSDSLEREQSNEGVRERQAARRRRPAQHKKIKVANAPVEALRAMPSVALGAAKVSPAMMNS